ncbi:solute carrier organic anion transporter family member 4C1-like [Glandiceps talaboti]
MESNSKDDVITSDVDDTKTEKNTTSETDESKANDEGSDLKEPLLCGWFSFRPKSLQWFNSIGWLVFSVSMLCFTQGMLISGLVPVSLTSIETRFQMTSTQLGIIVAAYDFTVLVLIVFVSYILATKNKPRWIGIGTAIIGIGALMWTLPQFLTGIYDPGAGIDYYPLCRPGQNVTYEECDSSWGSLSNYFYMFLFAQITIGIGASPIYTVGYAWVDENATIRKSGWYMGILSTMAMLGPAMGITIGALFLSIYTDPGVETDLTPSDSMYVGGWWIGFFIVFILAFLVSIPISSFSHPELPDTKNIQDHRRSQAHNDGSEDVINQEGFGKSWSDIWTATKLLCKNPPYMFVNLARCSGGLLLAGYTPFTPKFIENQFGITAAAAGLLTGAMAITAGAGGTLLGGYIVKKKNFDVRGNLKFCIGITIATLCICFIFLLRCPDEPLAGVLRSYDVADETTLSETNLTHACNADCQCATVTYVPVCALNDLQYYDACHAGCTYTPDRIYFFNCSCVDVPISHEYPQAWYGKCEQDCWQLPVYGIGLFISMLVGFAVLAPLAVLGLRLVPDGQRSYALGISSLLYRLFGAIPGPIIFGAIIDSSCEIWQETCNETGSCWIYNNREFGLKWVSMGVVFYSLTIFGYVMALVTYKAPPEGEGEGEGEGNKTKKATGMEAEANAAIKRDRSTASLLGYQRRPSFELTSMSNIELEVGVDSANVQ